MRPDEEEDLVRGAAPRILLLAVAACAAALLAALAVDVPLAAPPPPALVVLVAAFAATELRVLHLTVGRHTVSQSLSEVPLLLALVFADPVSLLVGRTLGPLLVHVLHRRSPLLKSGVNLLISTSEALVVLALVALLSPGGLGTSSGPALWGTAFVVAVSAALLSHALVLLAIAVSEGRAPALRAVVEQAMTVLVTSSVVTALALVGIHALRDDGRSAVLLLGVAVLVLLAFRGYAELVERHGALERLHAFSRSVSGTGPDDVLRAVLAQARELLQADYVAVHLDRAEGASLLVELRADGDLERRELFPSDDREGLLAEVRRTGRSLLVPRGDNEPRRRSHLRLSGRTDLVVAALPGASEPLGVVVAGDRLGGNVRSFTRHDVRLLETVAHHAGSVLQSGRLLERLRHDASHDALTGLANRRSLLRQAAGATAPGAEGVVGLLVLDLDGFTQVNEGLGAAAGDALLCSTADRLRALLPERAVASRLGRDEFAVLLPDLPDADAVLEEARRVRAALSTPMTVHGVTLSLAASAGLAVWPEDSADAESLLQDAEAALARARADGDAEVRRPTAGSTRSGTEQLELTADLQAALAESGLAVHVQPKAGLADGRVVGVEALVRWQHPRLGPVFPDVFVPLAERSGLIVPLTTHVLRTAVQHAASWHRAGEHLHVAVNLSPRSLVDELIVDEVLELLEAEGLPAGLLTLEVTEGSVIADPDRAERILGRLREAGVRLSLDDFGTGFSSLTHLKRLPVHEVKIDRSFVRHLAEDEDDAAIVRSIVDLGGNLRLDVVAEGVEDRRAWDLLVDLGCDLAQGYHLSRPMPVEEFPAWLAAHRAATGALPPVVPAPRPGSGQPEVVA